MILTRYQYSTNKWSGDATHDYTFNSANYPDKATFRINKLVSNTYDISIDLSDIVIALKILPWEPRIRAALEAIEGAQNMEEVKILLGLR